VDSIWRREAMGVGFALRLPSEAGRYYAFP
jgi:hypothetical protein